MRKAPPLVSGSFTQSRQEAGSHQGAGVQHAGAEDVKGVFPLDGRWGVISLLSPFCVCAVTIAGRARGLGAEETSRSRTGTVWESEADKLTEAGTLHTLTEC